MAQTDDRPTAGAADAAPGSAAADAGADGGAVGQVDAALGLIETGIAQLAAVDPAALPEACVTGTVRRLGRLHGRIEGIQARFVAAAEAAGLPERAGAASTTSWVAQQTGRSGGQAARTSRLAATTTDAPELTDAVAAGEVGPDHAATIATGLDNGELAPEDLDELLPAARRQTPAMFGRQARKLAGRRRQQQLRDREQVAAAERHHRQWRTPNGSLRYEGLLPPAEGDLLEKAIAGFYQPDSKDVPDDQRRTHQQRCADAMTALLDTALRSGEAGDLGGTRPHITVTVPYEAMAALADAEQAGTTGITDTGTVLSAAAFHELACDATFRRIVIGPDSRPMDIGRATRNWPAPIRAAIAAIDGGCRGPGCDLPPHRSIIHHIRWWENGGDTSVDNGVMICGRHHDLIHDHGWTVAMEPTTRTCTWKPPGPDVGTDGTDGTIRTHPDGPAARATPTARASLSSQPPGPNGQRETAPPDRGDTTRPTTSTRAARTGTRPGDPTDPTHPTHPPPAGADPPQTLTLDL